MVLFEAMMKGDGGSYGAKGAAYTTKSAQLASDVQEILLKIAWSGSSGRGTNTFGQWWHVSINKTQLTPRIHEAATPEEYDGDIFDVTVPNHIICVRRNGKVVWSGNSWPEALKPFTNPGHKRFYTKPDLEALLKELGLPYRVEDIQRDYWWHFGAVVTIQARKTKALYLNLGSFVDVVAGEDWVNLDILPLRKTIPAAVNFLQADLSQGLPMYAEGSVDIIRASHLIEHLTLEAAHLLLNECRRVLKPGGLIRIAVPDLEVMIKWYRAKTMDHFNIDQPVEFILAPTDGEKFSRLMFSGDYAHRAIYDYPMMENFLRQAGFQRVVRSTQGFSHSEAMQLETKDQHPEISLYVEAIK
jgi:SAM-dependent methyltransferase